MNCKHFAPPTATQGTMTVGPFICPWCEIDRLKGTLSLAEEGLANYAQKYEWRPIETATERVEALFWIRPGTREDGDWYCDTNGNPILAHDVPRLFMGMRGSWSSLMKATHWMPLPPPPQTAEHGAEQDTKY